MNGLHETYTALSIASVEAISLCINYSQFKWHKMFDFYTEGHREA